MRRPGNKFGVYVHIIVTKKNLVLTSYFYYYLEYQLVLHISVMTALEATCISMQSDKYNTLGNEALVI